MVDVWTLRAFVPRRLRSLPADLAGSVAVTVAVVVSVLAPVIRETPLRVPLALAFVLFVPGYVVVAALFPGRPPRRAEDAGRAAGAESGISGAERVAFSVGVSLATVPFVGLLATVTPWGLTATTFVVGVSALTLAVIPVAASRRRRLPESDRLRLPYRTWFVAVRTRLLEPETRGDAALTVALAASVLLAAATVGYAVAVPQEASYSSVALLTEDDAGELEFVDGDRPIASDANDGVVLRLENHEHRTTVYTVVVVEQAAEATDDGTVVHEQREIERFETGLDHGDTWTHEHDPEPTIDDDTVRIAWLVYLDGDVPEEPSTENAPYAVDRWLEPADD